MENPLNLENGKFLIKWLFPLLWRIISFELFVTVNFKFKFKLFFTITTFFVFVLIKTDLI